MLFHDIIQAITNPEKEKSVEVDIEVIDSFLCRSLLCSLTMLNQLQQNTTSERDVLIFKIERLNVSPKLHWHRKHVMINDAIHFVAPKFPLLLVSTSSDLSQAMKCAFGKSYTDYNASFDIANEHSDFVSYDNKLQYGKDANMLLFSFLQNSENNVNMAIETCFVYSGLCHGEVVSKVDENVINEKSFIRNKAQNHKDLKRLMEYENPFHRYI